MDLAKKFGGSKLRNSEMASTVIKLGDLVNLVNPLTSTLNLKMLMFNTTSENPFASRRLRRLRRLRRPGRRRLFSSLFARIFQNPLAESATPPIMASSNELVLDAQRTFRYQTATVLRGAYFQPLSREFTLLRGLAPTLASLLLASTPSASRNA